MRLRWGLGPVFTYEWLRMSRRWQLYALRSLFVLIVAGGLLAVWWSRLAGRPLLIRDLAATGETFFYALVGTQLALILLVAPAYTAGAICLDKSRGTLDHLFVTDLSNWELVVGKLAARLVPVLGLVACAMPLLFAAILLGGIDPDSAAGACIVTLGVALVGSTLALALSIWARKTHEVLLAVYIVLALAVLADLMWSALARHLGVIPPPSWLFATNPFHLAFLPYLAPGVSWLNAQFVFLGLAAALSAILVFVAALRIRVVAMRQAIVAPRIRRRSRHGWLGRIRFPLPGLSLDRNPAMWREWYYQQPSPWVRRAWWTYAGLAILFTMLSTYHHWNYMVWNSSPTELPPWVNGLQISIGLLLLSIVSVTSLGEERAHGTLEVLLTTPLSSTQILGAKWLVAYRPVLLLFVLPVLVVSPSLLHDDAWSAVCLLAVMVLAYGAAVTSLGLALATWVSRQSRALAGTVALFTFVTIAPFSPILLRMPMSRADLESIAFASPFFGPGALTAALQRVSHTPQIDRYLQWNMLWVVIYFSVAITLVLLTLATFDRCVGRGRSTSGLRRLFRSHVQRFDRGPILHEPCKRG